MYVLDQFVSTAAQHLVSGGFDIASDVLVFILRLQYFVLQASREETDHKSAAEVTK